MVLLDGEGSELGARPAVNLVAAKQEMTYLLSEAFAAEVGSTQRALGSAKVEVRDAQGLCAGHGLISQFAGRKNAAERVRGELKQSKLKRQQLWLDVAHG